jgi:zinc transport system substrate-binding protein
MLIKKVLSTATVTMGLILAGCGNEEQATITETSTNTLTVFTTIYPLADFTQKLGGDYVEVKSVYPPNADAHTYEPSTKDMISMANSDMFIYTGIGIEGFAEKAAASLQKENVHILKAADGIHLLGTNHTEAHDPELEDDHSDDEHHDEHNHTEGEIHGEDSHNEEYSHEEDSHTEEHSHEENHDHGDVDPHVWLDPILSIELAKNIKNSLIELMPDHSATFEANYLKLEEELIKLDDEYKTVIENSKTKYLLVAHGAYGYWESRYGIKQIPIAGLSPTQEPTQKGLQNIIEKSKEYQIHYVIFEQNVSSKVADIIQKELGAKSLTLHNLESITEEDLKQQNDYFSIMRKNLQTIKTALND